MGRKQIDDGYHMSENHEADSVMYPQQSSLLDDETVMKMGVVGHSSVCTCQRCGCATRISDMEF